MSRYRLGILILVSVFLFAACSSPVSSETKGPDSHSADSLSHLPALAGDYFPFASKETGLTYHVYVRLPEGYDANDRAKQHPVVYLTDGDSLFPMLAPMHIFMSYDDKIPDAIIVGIAYGSFDPSINKRDVDYASEAGAAAYQRFLSDELIPRIESHYSADSTRRILFGQSHGGNFVLYSAYTQPDLFWGRIGSNPSYRFDFNPTSNPPTQGTRADLKMIIASGERDYEALREKALAWNTQIESHVDLPWDVNFVTIEGGTHAASAPQVYREAMRALFGWEAKIEP